MGELGALFNPGMRHEIEERESKQNRREEEGNARDGDLRIDLASGIAVINIPGKPAGESPGETSSESAPTSRTVGAKASPAELARRSAHARAQERRINASRKGRSKDHSDAAKSDKAKSGSEKTEPTRTAPSPSSKASRAAL